MRKAEELTYESVLAFDRLSRVEIDRLERDMLRDILRHARDTVPFYEKTFAQVGFNPETLTETRRIEVLPLLDKAMILRHPEKFRSVFIEEGLLRIVQTGGSTGEPFRILTTRDDPHIQSTFNWAQWHRLGISPGNPVVAVTGMAHESSPAHTFVNHRPKDALLWIHRPSLDATPPWREILNAIRAHQPVLVRGFPSILAEIAQVMLDMSEPPFGSVQGISLSSEDILPSQREVIERAFGVRCFGFYGQSEHCVLAMECEASRAYHIYPGYAYVEIVDEHGRPITVPGKIGEVVGTSLLNYAMPLIRYRTGDLAAWDSGYCRCGRQHRRLSRLVGRKRSRIALPDGRAVYFGSDVYDELWYSPEMFKQIQFVQSRADVLNIKVVPFPDTDKGRLKHFIEGSMRRNLCDRLIYDIEFVSSVERTSRGKYLLFLQKYLN